MNPLVLKVIGILAVYRKWYAAGMTDKEISQKIRETYPAQARPFRPTR